ncbi:glycosyltransferase 87 family protein [Streptomyces sp. NPDC005423]|uniref:glycosyltransferase 87 family protein n=1 Tax=Streptomyces sp. NPDC005423 TaxID=3155343 RepID=UPI0033A5EF1B
MTVRSRSATPLLLAAVSLLAVSLLAFAALCWCRPVPMADALVYRAEGAAVLHGGDLYGLTVTKWRLPATYPPFAALLFVPASGLPVPVLKAVFLTGNVLLLGCLVHLSARLAGRPAPLPALLAATAVALWLEPVSQTLLFGQVNLAVVCLLLWDLTRPPGARGKGVAIGLATGVKLTPAVFVVHLLLRRRFREALTAATAFAATVLLGALALPAASVDYWTRRLYETDRVGKVWIVDNQSLQGLIARALRDPAPGLCWALPAAGVAVIGLRLAARTPDDRWGVLLTAVTALLVSPVSWSHHWVWCVPLIAVLLADGRLPAALLTTALFAARTMWLLPHQGGLDLRLPWWQQPLAAPYPLVGLAVLVSAGRRERGAGATGDVHAGPSAGAAGDSPAGPAREPAQFSARRSSASRMR